MGKQKRDPKSVELAKSILENYQPETVEDMHEALKDIFGPLFESMLEGELENHLGYPATKETDNHNNRRNGHGNKKVKTSYGEIPIEIPRDRDGSFEPYWMP